MEGEGERREREKRSEGRTAVSSSSCSLAQQRDREPHVSCDLQQPWRGKEREAGVVARCCSMRSSGRSGQLGA